MFLTPLNTNSLVIFNVMSTDFDTEYVHNKGFLKYCNYYNFVSLFHEGLIVISKDNNLH